MPTLNSNIAFKFGLQANYEAIASKDANTVYFTTDSQRLFIGDVEYTRPIQHGNTLPTGFLPPESFFYKEDTKTLYYSKDGEAWEACSNFYAHPSFTAKASGFYKVTVDSQGHVSAATAVTKADITGLGIPGTDTNTTYTFATGDANGQIKVTPSGGTAQNISVKGLGSAAYSNTSAFAPASHQHAAADITSVNASAITGVIDISHLPTGALERCVVVADDTARFKLTTSQVQTGDTVKVTATNKMYFVKDDTKLSTEAGYEVYTAGSATSVPWSGVSGKPSVTTSLTGDVTGSVSATLGGAVSVATTLANSGVTAGTYKSVTVDAKGRVTAGTNPTTLAGYGITDAVKEGSTFTAGQVLVADADGVAKTTGYTIAKSVPSDAKFTDTTYSVMSAASASAAGEAGLVPAPGAGKQASFLRGDGTWVVPTNTTYAADRGISLVSGKFGHSNAAVTAKTAATDATKTLTWGGTLKVDTVKYDAYGHITDTDVITFTMPANPNVDTKVNNVARGNTKAYLLATTTAPTSSAVGTTAVSETGVYLDAAGTLVATKFQGALDGNAKTATSAASATKATQDGNGANIASTYATKTELTNSALKWGTF